MIEILLDAIRFIVYTWGIYEVGCLTSLFYLAYKGEKVKNKFTLHTLIFSSSVLFMVITLLLMNILGSIFPDLSMVFRNAITLPAVAIALSARLFKRRYLE